MTPELGSAPYDALGVQIHEISKVPFKLCRITTDLICVIIALIFGGNIGIGTVITAFGTGPFVQFFNEHVSKPWLHHKRRGKYTREELRRLNRGKGGMLNLVGTADMKEIEARCLAGEQEFIEAFEAMAYAVSKNITALWPAFDGEKVDAVILTGGASRSQMLVNKIKKYVSAINVPVVVYPGELEMVALASGAARVLTGKEKAKSYLEV